MSPPNHCIALERSKAARATQRDSWRGATENEFNAPGIPYWLPDSSDNACVAVSFDKNSSSQAALDVTQRITAIRGILVTLEFGNDCGGALAANRTRSLGCSFAPGRIPLDAILGPGVTMAAKRSLRSFFSLKGMTTVRLRSLSRVASSNCSFAACSLPARATRHSRASCSAPDRERCGAD